MQSGVLVIDQGTTSTRAIVFDADGAPVADAQEEIPQIFPRPGWVEHDPESLWSSAVSTAREALRRARREPSDLAALGIANQRETSLIWDRATGKPIGNADRLAGPANGGGLFGAEGRRLRTASDGGDGSPA